MLRAGCPEALSSAVGAGASHGRAAAGNLGDAPELVAADLGADSTDGFLSMSALGWADALLEA